MSRCRQLQPHNWGTMEPLPPMLLPQASSVRPSTVLLSWKMMPRVRRMFTSSVAAALIHMALAKKPRKANTWQEEGKLGASSPASCVPPGNTRDQKGAQVPKLPAGLLRPLVCVWGWGHLTQWYLGGSSLVVVRKMMMARTEPTSMTRPQTGKMPWIWYSPSARSRERTCQCGPMGWAGSHQAGSVGSSLVPKATSTPPCWGRPHEGQGAWSYPAWGFVASSVVSPPWRTRGEPGVAVGSYRHPT